MISKASPHRKHFQIRMRSTTSYIHSTYTYTYTYTYIHTHSTLPGILTHRQIWPNYCSGTLKKKKTPTYIKRPFVQGMRLFNIHNGEICNVRKLLRQFKEVLQTRHERWSGTTAEVEHQRPSASDKFAQLRDFVAFCVDEARVGKLLARSRSSVRVHTPHPPQHFHHRWL